MAELRAAEPEALCNANGHREGFPWSLPLAAPLGSHCSGLQGSRTLRGAAKCSSGALVSAGSETGEAAVPAGPLYRWVSTSRGWL